MPAAEALSGGNIIAFDANLLFHMVIQTFNVLLLTGVLVRFLYNPVKKFIKERSEGIRAQLDEAETSLQHAQELKSTYRKKIDEIESIRRQVLEEARALAAEKSERLLYETQKRADQIILDARDEAQRERAAANEQIKTQVADLALLIAERFIRLSISDEQKRLLVEQAFKNMSARAESVR